MRKSLIFVACLLGAPLTAQSAGETLVQFTGFLGNLQFTADDLRADLSGPEGDTRQIAIAMNDEATQAYTLFTRTHVNQTVTFAVCGQAMETIRVTEPDTSGFALSDPMDADRAAQIVDVINGIGECPPPLDG